MIQAEFMKEDGFKIKDMEMGLKDLKMEMFIRENIKIINQMEKAFTIGLTMKFTMENGRMVVNMDQEFGKELKENRMLGNGKTTKYPEKDYMYGKMEINMKENGYQD